MKMKFLVLSLALTLLLAACGKAPVQTPEPEGNTPEPEETVPVTETMGPVTEDVVSETKMELVARKLTSDKRFSRQPETDRLLYEEYQQGYPLEDARYILDPYGLSPLTAVIFFETEEETRVAVSVKGTDESATIRHEFDTYSMKHSVPVYGLYAGRENEVEIVAVTKAGEEGRHTLSIRTDALPDDISDVIVEISEPEKMEYGLTFFDCPHVNGNYFLAIDTNGDIRWYLSDKSFNGCVMLTHLKNGNMLISSGEAIEGAYNNVRTVYEVTPLGQYVNEYNVYGIHHDIREESNGNLIFAASMEGSDSQNDYIVEVDRETGEILRDWNLREIIPMTEYDTQPPYTGGLSNWIHNNAVWYIEAEDAFIISGRHQNMVMKFDASTKEIRWILSKTVGELNEELRPYLLTPVDEDFEYPMSQHAAMAAPDGSILLFDNRNYDSVDEDGNLIQDKLYSRAVRYVIDEENMTVEEVWEYGKETGGELYSSFVSDVDYLGENHYLIDFGGMYKAEDGSNYDHIYTDADIKNASIRNSVVVEILNNKVVFKATLTGNSNSNTYKAERKDIYQNAVEAQFFSWE